MNIINILVRVSVIYIVMNGISSAAPPDILSGPVLVEQAKIVTVQTDEQPLEVSVTNFRPRVPFALSASCTIIHESQGCEADFPQLTDYPNGTDAAVIQEISYLQIAGNTSSTQVFSARWQGSYNETFYPHHFPKSRGFVTKLLREHSHAEQVTIYDDGSLVNGHSKTAHVFFSITELDPFVDTIQNVSISGYFTSFARNIGP